MEDETSEGSEEENETIRSSQLNQTIHLKQTIAQGSFLPVTLVASKGLIDVNEFVVDASQGAKLVHFMGHFGKLKALRTFVDRFDLRLDEEDSAEHTIVHYAAR